MNSFFYLKQEKKELFSHKTAPICALFHSYFLFTVMKNIKKSQRGLEISVKRCTLNGIRMKNKLSERERLFQQTVKTRGENMAKKIAPETDTKAAAEAEKIIKARAAEQQG